MDDSINKLISAIIETKYQGGTVMICGNGGLAATSEHFAAELSGKFAFDVYIPCIALTSNSSLTTALSNDIGFENLFAHQVEVFGKKEDLLIAMTTSRSKNILKALEVAKKRGIKSFAIVSSIRSGEIPPDFCITGAGSTVDEVQDNIMSILHKVAYQVKEKLCSKTSG